LAQQAEQGAAIFARHVDRLKAFTEVPVRPLLDVLAENDVTEIDLLKIDVEGFEDRALMPFFRKADRGLWPRALLIEHINASLWAEDVLGFMITNGYSIEGKNTSNTMLIQQKR
jgi:FkbM family methyltransferase